MDAFLKGIKSCLAFELLLSSFTMNDISCNISMINNVWLMEKEKRKNKFSNWAIFLICSLNWKKKKKEKEKNFTHERNIACNKNFIKLGGKKKKKKTTFINSTTTKKKKKKKKKKSYIH